MRKSLLFTILLSTLYSLLSTQSVAQENLTITTYYPSPSGSYNELRAEHIAIGYMNRSEACWDPTNPGCGTDISDNATRNIDLIIEGSVGIGTTTPNATLDVVGGVRVGDDTAACGILKEGTIRYNAGAMQYCDGMNWIAMGGAPIYRVYDPSATPGPQDFTVPEGVTYINIQLWGAGGGGGGALVRPTCPPAECPSGCSGISGGGAGGGAYIEAGYNVQGGEIYTITAGIGGSRGSGRYANNGDAGDGANGGESTFVRKSDGQVILTAGAGKGGKGGTQALFMSLCEGGAPVGAGGVASTVIGDTKLNLIGMINGKKGARYKGDNYNADGGDAANGGKGGEWCNFVWGVGNVTGGEFPGGGGAGGGAWSMGCTSPEAHPGGDGANGKVVLYW